MWKRKCYLSESIINKIERERRKRDEERNKNIS